MKTPQTSPPNWAGASAKDKFCRFRRRDADVAENARKKLEKKNADLVVANDVTRPGAGFAGDTNAVTIFSRTDAREVPLRGKREVAEAILDRVAELF